MREYDRQSDSVTHALALAVMGDVLAIPLDVANLVWGPPLEMDWGVTQLFVSLVLHKVCAVDMV